MNLNATGDTTTVVRLILASGRVLSLAAAGDIKHAHHTEESFIQLHKDLRQVTYASNALLDNLYSSAGTGSLQRQFTRTYPQGCLDALTEMEVRISRIDTPGVVSGIHSTIEYFDQSRDLFQELLDVNLDDDALDKAFDLNAGRRRKLHYKFDTESLADAVDSVDPDDSGHSTAHHDIEGEHPTKPMQVDVPAPQSSPEEQAPALPEPNNEVDSDPSYFGVKKLFRRRKKKNIPPASHDCHDSGWIERPVNDSTESVAGAKVGDRTIGETRDATGNGSSTASSVDQEIGCLSAISILLRRRESRAQSPSISGERLNRPGSSLSAPGPAPSSRPESRARSALSSRPPTAT